MMDPRMTVSHSLLDLDIYITVLIYPHLSLLALKESTHTYAIQSSNIRLPPCATPRPPPDLQSTHRLH